MRSASTSEGVPGGDVVTAVAPERVERWLQNFSSRHGATQLAVHDGALTGQAEDGSWFRASLPFSLDHAGPAEVSAFLAAGEAPADWGILLVRKGGFAVARLNGSTVVASKVGQRHVQGRTKAGGQSQQRFARRRDNQARVAYGAAADHAARLVPEVPLLVVGGDTGAVAATLEDPRLRMLPDRVVGRFLAVADPRRSVLEDACDQARAVQIVVHNAPEPQPAVL